MAVFQLARLPTFSPIKPRLDNFNRSEAELKPSVVSGAIFRSGGVADGLQSRFHVRYVSDPTACIGQRCSCRKNTNKFIVTGKASLPHHPVKDRVVAKSSFFCKAAKD